VIDAPGVGNGACAHRSAQMKSNTSIGLVILMALLAGFPWCLIASRSDLESLAVLAFITSAWLIIFFRTKWKSETAMFALMSVFAFIIASTWWHLWMNEGWIGTPRIIHSIASVDGEASYDATMTEMFLISFSVIFGFGLIFFKALKVKNSNRILGSD
jgi:hypothetical protein